MTAALVIIATLVAAAIAGHIIKRAFRKMPHSYEPMEFDDLPRAVTRIYDGAPFDATNTGEHCP